jgi:hypothetical protein
MSDMSNGLMRLWVHWLSSKVLWILCNLTDTAVAHRSNWSMITFGFQANLPPVMWWNLHCYCCSECSLVLAAGRCAHMLNFFLTIIQVLVLGFQVQTHGSRMLWWKASAAVLLFSHCISPQVQLHHPPTGMICTSDWIFCWLRKLYCCTLLLPSTSVTCAT